MYVRDESFEAARRETTARVMRRLGVAASALGDELFVDGIVGACLSALREGRPVELHRPTRTRAITATLVRAVTEELRVEGGTRTAAEIDALEARLRNLAAGDGVLRRSPTVRSDHLDIVIERHVAVLAREDRQTGEHSRAVAAWCRRIAERLGMSRSEIAFVGRCGLIHDVGKRNTPKEILQAARPLTDDEWKQMRQHVLDGFEIVKADPLLAPFALAVRNHHERYDGLGYPDGLSGSDIPLAVRIVTVADAFNAMIAPRPYRPSLPPALAVDELAWNRGSQFDPDVVDAMIDVVLTGGEEQ
jgi:putative nucleotidyltransferase with HDIG domain